MAALAGYLGIWNMALYSAAHVWKDSTERGRLRMLLEQVASRLSEPSSDRFWSCRRIPIMMSVICFCRKNAVPSSSSPVLNIGPPPAEKSGKFLDGRPKWLQLRKCAEDLIGSNSFKNRVAHIHGNRSAGAKCAADLIMFLTVNSQCHAEAILKFGALTISLFSTPNCEILLLTAPRHDDLTTDGQNKSASPRQPESDLRRNLTTVTEYRIGNFENA